MATAEPTGTIDVALNHARALLARDPRLAEQQAAEILRVAPRHAGAHLVLGSAFAAQGRVRESVAALETACRIDRNDAEAWRLLAAQLLAAGDEARANAAHAEELRASTSDPRLAQAARALCANDLPVAERLLRAHIAAIPDDIAALRMLAEVAGRLRRYEDARRILEHALAIAPGFAAARFNLAMVLHRQQRPMEALGQLDILLDADPANPAYRNLRGAVLSAIGDLDEAIASFESVLESRPDQPRIWMSYGHALKTVGRQADAIGAYRRAIGIEPRLGEVWWSLANLKTVSLGDADVALMEAALARVDLDPEDRFHLHFALGKSQEDAGRDEAAFSHYAEGNRLRRAMLPYDADQVRERTSRRVAQARALLTPAFFAARVGQGCPAPDPIFILGLPRAGSTLIEQILASHPLIEGTQELSDIQVLARREGGDDRADYPAGLAGLDAEALARLGAEYLERTRVQRKTDRPFFIDKMPNNWAHLPFIHLILPNAKIIDARRHPLACCFSNFKQHFARGQAFTYDLTDIGRYYADYVALTAHIDAVLPGRVHRVFHEALVDDLEGEVRRLLACLGLDFDPACLRFHETERAVRTASSEQVRRPITREGVDQWRRFDRWLGPLREALGPIVEDYPFKT